MATTRFADHLLTGTHAARPAANAVPAGTLYSCTTHALIYQSDGSSTWSTYATLGTTETLPASIIDAKGDLIAGTANDTAARLAVGTDGQVLTADAASTPGVKWAAAAGGASGALTLLSTTTLVAAGTFDVSSISGAYNDLILILVARDNAGSSPNDIQLLFNADSTSHYNWVRNTTTGTSSAATDSSGLTSRMEIGRVPVNTSIANSFGFITIQIAGYASTTWLKSVVSDSSYYHAAAAGGIGRQIAAGTWNQTTAITRVQLAVAGGGSFAIGSQLRIYGRL
jgi:hypothetical protein